MTDQPTKRRRLSDAEVSGIVSEIEDARALFVDAYRVVSQLTLPLSQNAVGNLALKLETHRNNIGRVVTIVTALRARPELQQRYEARILSGELRLRECYDSINAEVRASGAKPSRISEGPFSGEGARKIAEGISRLKGAMHAAATPNAAPKPAPRRKTKRKK